MIKLELHVRDFENISDYLNFRYQVISVGDEGCIYKVPMGNDAVEIASEIISNDKEFKYVIPKIADCHMGDVISTIKLLQKNIVKYTLVVNDLGVLFRCFIEKILPPEVNIGRALSRAVEDTPWADEYIKDEKYKLDYLVNTYADTPKIQYMKKYNVNGIESNLLPMSHLGFRKVVDSGWKVSAHVGNTALAFSRKCAYAHFKQLRLGECTKECNKIMDISMEQFTNGQDHKDCKKSYKDNVLDFYLLGNVLYKHPNTEIEDLNCDFVSSYVVHSYDYSIADLETMPEYIKR